ncbi:MAG: aminotransferase class I/II-fold pyridoxal phosphate-dependent enzyme [Desulfobacterales bacterium]|nr:aminotransferase class I/II-fold pyridoxal phosphate-dependent enzyme [Desulfobacterales bacterium]
MIMPALNPLVLSLKESATLAINLEALRLRNQGRRIFHFGFGQSPFPVPDTIQAALRDNVDKKDYLPTQGLPELLDAVAGFYNQQFGYDFKAGNICVGPGSKELIFQILYLMEGPLLVPAPSWVSYGPQAALRGKEIVPIITKRENSYRLQLDELDRTAHAMGQQQKLLILNNPNNPTGAVYTRDEIKELAAICRAYQIIVISDEIYAMIDFTDNAQASLAHYYPEGTIVTGGLSKSFAAGGYRLGVMLLPETLEIILNALKSVISETFSAVSAPIQYAALEAYANFAAVRPFIEKTNEIYGFVARYLHQRFVGMGLNCPRPEGSFYLFPDFENFKEQLNRREILTGMSLCKHLLEQFHVALLPGADFYLPATSFGVRVAAVDFDGQAVLDAWTGPLDMDEDKTRRLFPNLVDGCDSLEEFVRGLA